MDRIEQFEYTPETKIEYQPGIMLGTLELLLNFTKKQLSNKCLSLPLLMISVFKIYFKPECRLSSTGRAPDL